MRHNDEEPNWNFFDNRGDPVLIFLGYLLKGITLTFVLGVVYTWWSTCLEQKKYLANISDTGVTIESYFERPNEGTELLNWVVSMDFAYFMLTLITYSLACIAFGILVTILLHYFDPFGLMVEEREPQPALAPTL